MRNKILTILAIIASVFFSSCEGMRDLGYAYTDKIQIIINDSNLFTDSKISDNLTLDFYSTDNQNSDFSLQVPKTGMETELPIGNFDIICFPFLEDVDLFRNPSNPRASYISIKQDLVRQTDSSFYSISPAYLFAGNTSPNLSMSRLHIAMDRLSDQLNIVVDVEDKLSLISFIAQLSGICGDVNLYTKQPSRQQLYNGNLRFDKKNESWVSRFICPSLATANDFEVGTQKILNFHFNTISGVVSKSFDVTEVLDKIRNNTITLYLSVEGNFPNIEIKLDGYDNKDTVVIPI